MAGLVFWDLFPKRCLRLGPRSSGYFVAVPLSGRIRPLILERLGFTGLVERGGIRLRAGRT